MKKSGYSLIELLVAMAILMVVMTVAIGAFITVARIKSLASIMRTSQQKVRISVESVARLARQSDFVNISPDKHIIEIYSAGDSALGIPAAGKKFEIIALPSADPAATDPATGTPNFTLLSSNCEDIASTIDACNTWSSPSTDMLGREILLSTNSKFERSADILTIVLDGRISKMRGLAVDPYFSDSIRLQTAVIMENVL